MASLTDVFVPVRPDMRDFEPDMKRRLRRIDASTDGKRVGKSFGDNVGKGMSPSLKRAAGAMAGAFAAVKVGGFLKGAIQGASDLSETTSKVARIFGTQATPALQAFAASAAKNLGQSKQSALDATATFGVFGKAAGLAGKPLVEFSTDMTKLSSDMASFSNTTPEEAIEAIGAALRGESEPIRKYGVLLDDATLRNRALKLGLIDSVKTALTPQHKALAAQAEIMAQTTLAQGDFARTSGGLANQQRILSAQFANVKTSIGKVALPIVTKFFTFLNTTAIPALRAMAAAFRTGKTEDEGTKIERLGLAFRSAFGFLKTEVLPRLREFATFLGEQVVPRVVSLAKWINRNKDFLIPFATTIGVIIGALKLWAAVQLGLNILLATNPIGLVILALAALVGGLVMAYKRSETFRKIVDTAMRVAGMAAKWMWENAIRPAFSKIATAFKAVGTAAKFMYANVLKPVFRFIITAWLTVAGAIINGAAKAFGWVPGLGPKLKRAAQNFNTFRDIANRALGGIRNQTSTVGVRINGKSVRVRTQGQNVYISSGGTTSRAMARGGPILTGSGLRDDVPAMLKRGEHVWTDKEVAAAGGHQAMLQMRRAVLGEQFATGGGVGVRVRRPTQSGVRGITRPYNPALTDFAHREGEIVQRQVQAIVNRIAGSLALAGGGGWRKQWAAVHGAFPGAQLISGYRPGAITATGNRSYHGMGRAIDVTPSMAIFDWIRSRYGKKTKELIYSPAGGRQVHNGSPHYYSGITRSMHWDHVHWAYDKGGWLPPGRSIAYNGTGKPERVTPADQPMRLHPADIKALGQVMGQVVLTGVGASNVAMARSADRLVRGG